MVLPRAIYPKILARISFLCEAGLLQKRFRRKIVWQASGLDAMKSKFFDCVHNHCPKAIPHVTAPGVRFAGPIAD